MVSNLDPRLGAAIHRSVRNELALLDHFLAQECADTSSSLGPTGGAESAMKAGEGEEVLVVSEQFSDLLLVPSILCGVLFEIWRTARPHEG